MVESNVIEVKIKDVFELQMGKTPARNNAQYWEGNKKWISIADIGKAGKVISDTKECITDMAVSESGIKVVPKGTVIMSFKLSIGKTAITADDMFTNEAIMAFINKGIYDIDTNYLYHYCSGNDWSEGSNKAVKGITLNKATLAEKTIKLPNVEMQQHIACELDAVDDLIRIKNEELDNLEQLIKSRFIELFGDTVTNPMLWDEKPLSDCLHGIENGRSFVCDNVPRTGNYPAVLKLSAATYGFYQPHENKAMLDENEFVDKAEIHKGDLLFTRKNTPELVGMCAYVFETPEKLMMPDLIFRLNTKDIINKIYLWQLINHELFRSKIQALAGGSAKSMSNISKERLLSLIIPVPPIELQQQFADFVEQVEKAKQVIKEQLEQLETLKKSLMQKYFG